MERLAVVSQLIEKLLRGDRRALARLLTLLEKDAETTASIMRAIYPRVGSAYVIGVTGPPGAGKSTIVDGLIQVMRGLQATVGVLAVDPTSPFSGGAVLGDRIRLQRHYLDTGVFIRSVATRGAHGGLSPVASAAVKLLDAFGNDVVIVEPVGVGQTELDIIRVADTVVVVLVPEAGDGVQAMKAGLLEIADVVVVNKSDRQGADRLAAAVRATLRLNDYKARWRPPVLLTQAHKGEGIQALYDTILEHRNALEATSDLERRRGLRHRQEFARALEEAIQARIRGLMSQDGALGALAARVEYGEVDPYSAAAQALEDDRVFSQLAQALQGQPDTRLDAGGLRRAET